MTVLLISETEKTDYGLSRKERPVTQCTYAEALRFLEQLSVQVILLDFDVTPKKGLDTLALLKKIQPAIPVIVLSATSSETIILEAFRLGAKDFYKKPLQTKHLAMAIDNVRKIIGQLDEKRRHIMVSASAIQAPTGIDTTVPDNILKAIGYMEDNLGRQLCLTTLARKAGMSKFHFTRTFKKHLGESPMHFFSRIRLKKAKTLLGCSNHTISQVALDLGYNDLSTFNRSFKKTFGITPSAFRSYLKARKYSR